MNSTRAAITTVAVAYTVLGIAFALQSGADGAGTVVLGFLLFILGARAAGLPNWGRYVGWTQLAALLWLAIAYNGAAAEQRRVTEATIETFAQLFEKRPQRQIVWWMIASGHAVIAVTSLAIIGDTALSVARWEAGLSSQKRTKLIVDVVLGASATLVAAAVLSVLGCPAKP